MPKRRSPGLKALRAPKRGKRAPARSPEETRAALLDSGMALFAKHGLDGPSLDDICANAGVTRGAFYVHFADRDEFLVAVMDRVGGPLLDELLNGEGGLAGAMQRFMDAIAKGRYPLMAAKDGGGIRPYQFLDACARVPALRKRYLALVASTTTRIAELVKEGQAGGLLRADVSSESVASFAMALIVGMQTLADLGQEPNLEIVGPQLFALLKA